MRQSTEFFGCVGDGLGAMNDEHTRHLKQIARGVVKANARLGQVLELLERGGGGETKPTLPLEPMLDLLQALEDSLDASAAGLTTRQLSWWERLLGASSSPIRGPTWQGLELARQRAHEQLASLGILPTPRSGPPNPMLHSILNIVPCPRGGAPGHVAEVHQQGWYRDHPDGPRPLRVATVSVFSQGNTPSDEQ